MSLHVCVAHSGERLLADPVSFGSLDTFKAWLSEASSIAPANQILLTGSGKQVKVQALLTEVCSHPRRVHFAPTNPRAQRDIFLFDRQLVSSGVNAPKSALATIPHPIRHAPEDPPDTLSNQNDLNAWLGLFEGRRQWAVRVAEACQAMSVQVHHHFGCASTIDRALTVALGNLESHVHSLKQKQSEARTWTDQVLRDQEGALIAMNTILAQLPSIPADMEFYRFMPHFENVSHAPNVESQSNATLQAFLSPRDAQDASTRVKSIRGVLEDRVKALGRDVDNIVADAEELSAAVENRNQAAVLDTSKAAAELMEEIDVVVKKIASDAEHVASLDQIPRAISQASKMALLHTRNYLPTLKENTVEMSEILEKAIDRRNASSMHAITQMKRIAGIEASYAAVNANIMAFDVPPDAAVAFDKISFLTQLPSIYGALLTEAVRRREWSERIRGESSILAEDIAGYKEEEERRRKKWLRSLGNLVNVDVAKGDALKFELNLQAEDHDWPSVSRENITDFLDSIATLPGLEDVTNEVTQASKDLDRPTKRQVKKAKAFKMGSVHEAAFGKGSFLLREDYEMRILKDANMRLEEELKGQKSRVRKLEDLVHKQNQVRRPSSGDIFQPADLRPSTPPNNTSSPKPHDGLSRQVSFNNRRTSMTKTNDEKSLARRIVSLEADLLSERNRRTEMEKTIMTSHENETKMKGEADEAQSIKRDLMENMDAQQREFAAERQSLEEEINRYKIKLEEAEDELDRILGSRDNEKLGTERKVEVMEQELEHTKKTLKTFQDQAEEQREMQEIHAATLRDIHSKFSSTEPIPQTQTQLIEGLDTLAERSLQRAQDLTQTLALVRSENANIQSELEERDKQNAALGAQLTSLEQDLKLTRDRADVEEAKSRSLACDVEDGRTQLRLLRAKFAEGETGSESLRQRVEEQAARASQLATELASAKSHINSLDVELLTTQKKHQLLQTELTSTTARLDGRADRARDLTQRLTTQRRELLRLLENVGLVVTLRDGSMVVQRASRVSNGSSMLSEPASSASRSAMTPVTTGTSIEEHIDPNLLQWMNARTADDEGARFAQFLERFHTFDLTAFSEAIVKLRRDVEWTGMKWKKEARNYRDRYHKTQGESHEKIAFRSFKEGDLALFLPTRNQATRPWAAFNVGAPHYFLREQDAHKLQHREWLVARISRIEERVVDLSKTLTGLHPGRQQIGETSDGGASVEDDNPFELSDGLRWYLLDATEEKPGAPSTPGLGKTTVASANVDAKGSIRMKKSSSGNDASTKLNKSLDSRRSSSHSKTGVSPQEVMGVNSLTVEAGNDSRRSSMSHLRPGSQSGPGSGPNTGSARPVGIASNEHARGSSVDEQWLSKASPARSLLGIIASANPTHHESPPKEPRPSPPVPIHSPLTTSAYHQKEEQTPSRSPRKSQQSPSKAQLDPADNSLQTAQGGQPQLSPSRPQRSPSRPTARSEDTSPSKGKRSAWDSIFSLDVSVEGGKARR